MRLGIPYELAQRMSIDMQNIPYYPEQINNISQLNAVLTHEVTSYSWWDDYVKIFNQIVGLWPGFLILGTGVILTYVLKDVKISKIPLSLIGTVPLLYGTYYIVKPFIKM